MKFLIMILTDEEAARARSGAEIEATTAQHGAVARGLHEAGRLVSAHRLAFSSEASTIRLRDGRPQLMGSDRLGKSPAAMRNADGHPGE